MGISATAFLTGTTASSGTSTGASPASGDGTLFGALLGLTQAGAETLSAKTGQTLAASPLANLPIGNTDLAALLQRAQEESGIDLATLLTTAATDKAGAAEDAQSLLNSFAGLASSELGIDINASAPQSLIGAFNPAAIEETATTEEAISANSVPAIETVADIAAFGVANTENPAIPAGVEAALPPATPQLSVASTEPGPPQTAAAAAAAAVKALFPDAKAQSLSPTGSTTTAADDVALTQLAAGAGKSALGDTITTGLRSTEESVSDADALMAKLTGRETASDAKAPRPEFMAAMAKPAAADTSALLQLQQVETGAAPMVVDVAGVRPGATGSVLTYSSTGQAVAVPLNNIAVEISRQMQAGNNRFQIRLDPPELGRIDVRLEVSRDGHVNTRLMVDNVETYDAIQRDPRGLERALQSAGLKLEDGSVQVTLRDSNQFSGRDSSGQQQQQAGQQAYANYQDDSAAEEAVTLEAWQIGSLSGGLDLSV